MGLSPLPHCAYVVVCICPVVESTTSHVCIMTLHVVLAVAYTVVVALGNIGMHGTIASLLTNIQNNIIPRLLYCAGVTGGLLGVWMVLLCFVCLV